MKSPRGFIKTAGRGSAYRSVTGTHWIKKLGTKWHVIEMRESSEGRKPVTIAEFKTMTDAAQHYRELTN